MGEWKEYSLGDIAEVQTGPFGSQLHQSDYKLIGTPIITVEHLGENKIIHQNVPLVGEEDRQRLIKYTLQEGDIVFSRVGSVDRRVYVTKDENGWMFSGRCLRVRPDNKKVHPKFLSYYFGQESFKETIRRIAVGATMPSINTTILSEVDVSLPDFDYQLNIASILSSLDDKIDLLHRQNKTLDQLAETIFRQWFVNHSTRLGKLGSLIESTFGGEWGKEISEGEYNFPVNCIRGTDIADLQTGLANRTPLRFVKEKKYKSIEMQIGDLVMEISGGSDDQSTGRTILINDEVKNLFNYPLVFSNFCRLIRPTNSEFALYLLCYINLLYDQGDFFNLENGSSGIRNFDYKAFLYELEYEIHDQSQIIKFDKSVKHFFEKINKNKFQIRTLTQLRDTLLPKLMSGEVRVK